MLSAARAACAGWLLAALVVPCWADTALPAAAELLPPSHPVDFRGVDPGAAVRIHAKWALRTGDNQGLPFIVVDKKNARVFVFNPEGVLLGDAPALLGLAIGDDSVPGIGQRKLSSIRPEERTTPAGRFVAGLDRNISNDVILWVDYDAAISMHALRSSDVSEKRPLRLASETPADNRISFGCINVSPQFFARVVTKAFAATQGIVYVLPETRAPGESYGPVDLTN